MCYNAYFINNIKLLHVYSTNLIQHINLNECLKHYFYIHCLILILKHVISVLKLFQANFIFDNKLPYYLMSMFYMSVIIHIKSQLFSKTLNIHHISLFLEKSQILYYISSIISLLNFNTIYYLKLYFWRLLTI